MDIYNNLPGGVNEDVSVRAYEIPIRIRALRTANIYIIETGNRKILVDSGMGPEVDNFLKFAGEDVKDIDMIILSHLHIDHIGGAVHLRSKYGIPVGLGRNDVSILERIRNNPDDFTEKYASHLRENGMPEGHVKTSLKDTPIMREMEYYRKFEVDIPLDESYTIQGSDLKIIEVPGHSPGSICIHLPGRKIVMTGDHILKSISPNISKYVGINDSLGSYLKSLKKLRGLDVKDVLPGHGKLFKGLHARVDELISHHSARMNEVKDIATRWSPSYEIARRMTWSKGRSMDSMNSMEKIFAMGEATSHLERLEEEGLVESRVAEGVRQYRTVA